MPLRRSRNRWFAHLDVVGIALFTVLGVVVTTVKYETEVGQLQEDYRGRRQLEAKLVAERVEGMFRQLYQGLRTMTLLPGVRTIDRRGEHFAADSRAAMQQIYNNTYANVQLSEVYILPPTLDPDRIDPETGEGEAPVLTFDEFIVGAGEQPVRDGRHEGHEEHAEELPEDELAEYRQYKLHLEELARRYPTNRTFSGMEVPALTSAPIVTCDNTEWTAEHHARGDDEPRTGIALTVPRYDLEGRFAGAVSGIVRTRVLARMVPPGIAGIAAPQRGFVASLSPAAEWLQSQRNFAAGQANPDLIFSTVIDLKVVDSVPWQLWIACPDDDFWGLPEVGKTRTLWLFGIGMVGLVAAFGGWFARDSRLRHRALERMVAATTEELSASNRRMRLILDNAAQGFLMVELDGRVAAGSSQAVTSWFGPAAPGTPLCDYLYADDRTGAGVFACSFEQLVEGALPFVVAADQMPRRLERGGRTFGLDYQAVLEGERLRRLLVVVSDVTAAVDAERAGAESHELHQAMQHLVGDHLAFRRFVGECDHLLGELQTTTDLVVQRRLLHTLKGNTAIHGFGRFAVQCHGLEDRLAESEAAAAGTVFTGLQQAWDNLRDRLAVFLSPDSGLRIEHDHFDQLVQRVRARARHEELLEELQAWQLEPLLSHLRPMAMQAERLAAVLGKRLVVDVDDHCVRMPEGALPLVWPTLVHLVRNAVDHGIESPEERLAVGKPAAGRLSLTSDLTADSLELVVEDDGRGIAWQVVAAKAAAKGLPHQSHADLVAALFADGVSTATVVTAVSGRGIGMSAVREACEAAGGRLQVVSEPGRGTRWTVQVPRRRIGGLAQVCFGTGHARHGGARDAVAIGAARS